MNSRLNTKVVRKIVTRTVSWLAVGGVLAAASSTAATTMSACGESGACTNLRETTYANLETWQACDPAGPPDQCIPEPGNSKDCTGVLACDFAVNAKYRAQAELRVYSIGEASQGCYLCAVPNCASVTIAVCEPISRRCLGVTSVIDGGSFIISTSPPPSGDAGGTTPPPLSSDAGDATVPVL
jgi:hypothetical protein